MRDYCFVASALLWLLVGQAAAGLGGHANGQIM